MNQESHKVPFFVISGPSGSGKTSICRKIAKEYNWYYSVSHTTRAQKDSEINGRDYFFVTENDFLKLKDQGEFLEWALVYDNYYGTSKKIIEDKLLAGQGVILDVDTQGAANIKKIIPQAILVFIKTVDVKELKKRLVVRDRDSSQEIDKRIEWAEHEINHIGQYKYVVVNDDLERAVTEIKNIIDGELC